MTTTLPANHNTTAGFKDIAIAALNANLSNTLEVVVPDFAALLDAAISALDDAIYEDTCTSLEDLSEVGDLHTLATEIDLAGYIALNPFFGDFLDVPFVTDQALHVTLYNAFIDEVTRAPERAIRSYIEDTYGIDPINEPWTIDEN